MSSHLRPNDRKPHKALSVIRRAERHIQFACRAYQFCDLLGRSFGIEILLSVIALKHRNILKYHRSRASFRFPQ
jgi:hypothetical protein